MPRICHIGDPHIREGARFDEIKRCLNFAAADAIAQDVDLFVIPGDVFDAKSTPAERNAFAALLSKMAGHAPVAIIYGNHDKEGDLDIFGALETKHPVVVFNRPSVIELGGVRLFGFPHFNKANATAMLPAGLAIEESDATMTEAVRGLLNHWKAFIASVDAHGKPEPILMIGHLSVEGSMLSNGETLAHHGIQLSISDLSEVGFDAVALNHIHKAQVCDAAGRIRYAGSPYRANFGEEKDPKGYLIWNLPARGAEPFVEFRDIPARPMLTFTADFDTETNGWFHNCDGTVDGADVRVRITVPEDRAAEADQFAAKIRKDLADAHTLQVEIRTVPVTRVRAGQIAVALTPAQKLEAFWQATESPDVRTSAGAKAKLAELEAEVG